MSPARRRACIDHGRSQFRVSEWKACRVLGQHRSTQRKLPRGRADEARLVANMIELARQYGRYGYRRIAALLRDAGWQVNDKHVECLWRREVLKVPAKQPKKRRLWLNDGSYVRLRPGYRNHVWSYDFVHCRTDDGKAFRTLNTPGLLVAQKVVTERWRKSLNGHPWQIRRPFAANRAVVKLSILEKDRGQYW